MCCRAYRIPPAIIGNGVRSIKQLLEAKNALRSRNPHLRSRPIKVDLHRLAILRSQGYDLNSVPPKGQSVLVDLKAGFSTGASSCNITSHVHPLMKGVVERAAGAVGGLDVVGVDILARDHSAAPENGNYIVVEANTRPGIGGHHFPSFGAPINVCRIIAESCVRKMARLLGGAPHHAGGEVVMPSQVAEPMPAVDPNSSSKRHAGTPDWQHRQRGEDRKADVVTLVFVGDTSLGDAYLGARWPEAKIGSRMILIVFLNDSTR